MTDRDHIRSMMAAVVMAAAAVVMAAAVTTMPRLVAMPLFAPVVAGTVISAITVVRPARHSLSDAAKSVEQSHDNLPFTQIPRMDRRLAKSDPPPSGTVKGDTIEARHCRPSSD